MVGLNARRLKQPEQDALALIGLEVEDLAVQVDEPARQRLSHEGHTFAGDSLSARDLLGAQDRPKVLWRRRRGRGPNLVERDPPGPHPTEFGRLRFWASSR